MKSKKFNNNISIKTRAIAGMSGAIVDVIKTRTQLYHSKIGMFRMGFNIVSKEGFLALYKGLTPWMTHMVCKYCVRYSMAEFFRRSFSDKNNNISTINSFLAGSCAGAIEAIIIVTPFEAVKIRMQQQKGLKKGFLKYKNPLHCTITMLREEGSFALHKGWIPTTCRQSTNQFFVFGVYPLLKRYLWNKNYSDSISQIQSFITGIISGSIGPFFNCPLDVAKTRIQAQGKERYYRGLLHCIYKVYREEGVLALWRGIIPRVSRVAPGQGITWAVMELIFRLSRGDRKEKNNLYEGE